MYSLEWKRVLGSLVLLGNVGREAIIDKEISTSQERPLDWNKEKGSLGHPDSFPICKGKPEEFLL